MEERGHAVGVRRRLGGIPADGGGGASRYDFVHRPIDRFLAFVGRQRLSVFLVVGAAGPVGQPCGTANGRQRLLLTAPSLARPINHISWSNIHFILNVSFIPLGAERKERVGADSILNRSQGGKGGEEFAQK